VVHQFRSTRLASPERLQEAVQLLLRSDHRFISHNRKWLSDVSELSACDERIVLTSQRLRNLLRPLDSLIHIAVMSHR
jgi:hypothetical protein